MARAKVKPIVDVELPADDDLREVDGPTAVTGVGIDVQFKGDKEPWRLRTLELENDEHLDQLQELLDDARQRNAVKDVAAKAFAAIGEAFQAIDAEKVRIAGEGIQVEPITIEINWEGESDLELLENLATLLHELDERGIDINSCDQFVDADYVDKRREAAGLFVEDEAAYELQESHYPALAVQGVCVQAEPREYRRTVVTTVTVTGPDGFLNKTVTETVETNS